MTTIKLPKIWIGYTLAGLLLAIEITEGVRQPENDATNSPLIFLIGLIGLIYWLVCVAKLHKIIRGINQDQYPISPAQAAWLHFMPLFSLFWIFRWTGEMAKMINHYARETRLNAMVPGVLLIAGFIIGRAVDGAIGMAIQFWVLQYLIKHLTHVFEGSVAPGRGGPLPPFEGKRLSKSAGVIIFFLLMIPVMGILAAIAIPNLIRARENAQNRAASTPVRTVNPS